MTKYNQQSYEWAIRQVLPELVRAMGSGARFTVPDITNQAAHKAFLQYGKSEASVADHAAFTVLSTFAQQLQTTGEWQFGETDIFSVLSDKDIKNAV